MRAPQPRIAVVLRVLAAWLCGMLLATTAFAQGSVQGELEAGGQKTPLKFARAELHDNAEGLLDKGPELRILLTDVEVGPEAIYGIAFLPVTVQAREGKVRGVLVTMQPNDPGVAYVTVLAVPTEKGASLTTFSLSSKPVPVIADFKMDGKTVSGSFKFGSEELRSSGLKFSAPINPEPAVSADLKGKAAQDSAQVKSMRARATAMSKGDAAGVAKLSTPAENRDLEGAVAALGPQATQMMREAGRDMLGTFGKVERVVVRGERAVVIFRNKESWQDMALVDGQWKTGK